MKGIFKIHTRKWFKSRIGKIVKNEILNFTIKIESPLHAEAMYLAQHDNSLRYSDININNKK